MHDPINSLYSAAACSRIVHIATGYPVSHPIISRLARFGPIVPTGGPKPHKQRSDLYTFGELLLLTTLTYVKTHTLSTSFFRVNNLAQISRELQERAADPEPPKWLVRYSDPHTMALTDTLDPDEPCLIIPMRPLIDAVIVASEKNKLDGLLN